MCTVESGPGWCRFEERGCRGKGGGEGGDSAMIRHGPSMGSMARMANANGMELRRADSLTPRHAVRGPDLSSSWSSSSRCGEK